MPDAVPVVDLALPDAEAAAAIHRACTGFGFLYVTGHGVPEALVARQFAESARLFSLPLEEKLKLLADEGNRGYTPLAEETLDPVLQKFGDTKEGYRVGVEIPPGETERLAKPLHGPNRWPPEDLLPGWRGTMLEYHGAMMSLGLRLVRLMAMGLGLPSDYFDTKFRDPICTLRLLKYTDAKSNPEAGLYAAGAHSACF